MTANQTASGPFPDPADLAESGSPSDNESLTDVLRSLGDAGFSSSFLPRAGGTLQCGSCGTAGRAGDLEVAAERRLEGASDPDDLILVVAASCGSCGAGGVAVLGYGPGASEVDADIVVALDESTATVVDTDQPGDDHAGESEAADRPRGLERIVSAIDAVEGLDRLADPLQRSIDQLLPQRARDVLQGRWLGHPLHPVLTDLPIGCWTSAWLLDLFGGERAEPSADALIALGVATAVPTIWTGWSEWIKLPRPRRRSGLVHAASNGAATALYAGSLIARSRGDRRLGRRLGHGAAAAATFGGLLGGHLAFGSD